MSERAYVREVGLRDGLQSLAEIMPTEQKIAWLEAEHAAGVRTMARFITHVPLRWTDQDAFGHVNNDSDGRDIQISVIVSLLEIASAQIDHEAARIGISDSLTVRGVVHRIMCERKAGAPDICRDKLGKRFSVNLIM